jgi:hypothetical protein
MAKELDKHKTLRQQRIKPRLGFGGKGWLLTFLSMNDDRPNRTIEFVCSHGECFELELSADPKKKSFIRLHLRWKEGVSNGKQ